MRPTPGLLSPVDLLASAPRRRPPVCGCTGRSVSAPVGRITSCCAQGWAPTPCACIPADSLPDEDLDSEAAGPLLSVTCGLRWPCLLKWTHHPSSGSGEGGAWNSSWLFCVIKAPQMSVKREGVSSEVHTSLEILSAQLGVHASLPLLAPAGCTDLSRT